MKLLGTIINTDQVTGNVMFLYFPTPELYKEIEVYNLEFKPEFIKDGEWWERCKRVFRKIIVKYSRQNSNKLKAEIKRLEEN